MNVDNIKKVPSSMRHTKIDLTTYKAILAEISMPRDRRYYFEDGSVSPRFIAIRSRNEWIRAPFMGQKRVAALEAWIESCGLKFECVAE